MTTGLLWALRLFDFFIFEQSRAQQTNRQSRPEELRYTLNRKKRNKIKTRMCCAHKTQKAYFLINKINNKFASRKLNWNFFSCFRNKEDFLLSDSTLNRCDLPKYWRWTRIWCMRPVSGLQRTTLVVPLKPSFSNLVVQSLPFGDTLHTPIL